MITFVGAGPGAVDLITVRGMRLLEQADVIIYDGSLVNPKLLTYAREDAVVRDSARMTLEEITELMIRADGEGKEVVRLHTGEPSLYGAVREQMDVLDAHGIRYESCPGVSACFGAAAGADLEFTLPGVTQTLIITRMEGKTAVPEKEKLALLAAHRASMAIYLSAGMLEDVSRELIRGGLEEETPAMIVYKATWPEEKRISCTVGTLAQTGAEHHITKTAVVLVGDAMGMTGYDRSKLYDPAYSTEYRKTRV
ncbi:MAG: precorrin-4 C(11)-methyltransferase [Lachnospiraceae bacterium]|nr:precorrin-4 C(11)-methyltransferase [Lachnospiraceae bacterium]